MPAAWVRDLATTSAMAKEYDNLPLHLVGLSSFVRTDDDADDEMIVTTKSNVSRPNFTICGDGCDEEIPKTYRSREARSEFC